jgi:hypothetical protein
MEQFACQRCQHHTDDHQPEPIFDEDDPPGDECGNCNPCWENLQARVAEDRLARPAQYREPYR